MIDFIWTYMTRHLRKTIVDANSHINQLKFTITSLNLKLSDLKNDNLLKVNTITELKKSLRTLKNDQEREDYWNTRWNHNPIRYKAQGKYYRDIRSLINYPSYLIDEAVLFDGLKKDTFEETIYSIHNWVTKNVKYGSDILIHKVPEHWDDSDITLQRKTADCDSGSILFKALCLGCGIDDYKVKVVAGFVKNPRDPTQRVGHAYPIVLWNDDWYIFDWCYYPDRTEFPNRIKAKNDKRYKSLWFTFTKGFSFSDKSFDIKKTKIKALPKEHTKCYRRKPKGLPK